ncbi:MAG TPA: serine hydrolase domain-containing protein [Thermotogota bacterium]|nr:serine hydrolase domain-containing protein [Thermotogota bacterium]
MKNAYLILLFLALLPVACLCQQPWETQLETYLQHQVERHRLPGLAVVVVSPGAGARYFCFGEATPGVPVTPTTRFRVGSLSKAMTATAVLWLAQQGMLDLDAPVRQYIPGFTTRDPSWAGKTTLRHLLNQTSGLSDTGYNSLKAPRDASLQAVVDNLSHAEAFAPPGTQFAYFNPNYDVLGRIVEVISGSSYGDFMAQNVFSPLGMERAIALDVFSPEPIAGLAQGHVAFFGFPVAFPERLNAHAPSGGIVASAADLGAFLHSFFPGTASGLLSQQGINTMVLPPEGVASPYGMGWFQSTLPDRTPVLSHGGDIQTMHADMVFLPGAQKAFALLFNRQNLLSAFSAYPEIQNGVASILLGKEPSKGISGSFLGMLIAGIGFLALAWQLFFLVRHPKWAHKWRGKSFARVFPGLLLPLVPMALLLLFPRLILWGSGRVIDFSTLIAYLPDVVLVLFLVGLLGVVRSVLRLFTVLQTPSR